jgi:hypothetical protein
MFHNSTTIWHFPRQETSFYKENRRSFLLLDLLKTAATTTLRTVGIVGRFAWNIAQPIRLPFRIAWGGMKKGMEYVNKGIDHAEWGVRCTREALTGVFYTGLGKGAFEMVRGPLDFLKYNLVDNTRTILTDILTLKTPRNILKSPGAAWEGMRKGMQETGQNARELYKNVKAVSPLKAINSARKTVWSLLRTPFKAVGNAAKTAGETPIKAGSNILKSKWAYVEHMYKAPGHLKEGWERVRNAPATATEEMEDKDIYHIKKFPIFLKDRAKGIAEKTREKVGKWWAAGTGVAPAGVAKHAAANAH